MSFSEWGLLTLFLTVVHSDLNSVAGQATGIDFVAFS
jgi:hypothetical protein